jgi:hypothetical protein
MQSQQQFIDLYRASLRSAADLMKSSLQQTERVHQQQLEIVRSALEEAERSTHQVSDAKSIDDIFALNTRLAGTQIERITEFWSNVWRAAGESQKLMVDQLQAQLGQAKDRMRQSYELSARTSEEAARLATRQMTETADQMRETVVEQDRHAQGLGQTQVRRTETRKSA